MLGTPCISESCTVKALLKALSIICFVLFVSAGAALFFSPKPTLLEGIDFSTTVYDKNHTLLRITLTREDKYRVFVPLEAMAPMLISATLEQEDRFFYHHPGINPLSLTRAVFETFVRRARRVGASTISMQLARLRFGMPSRTFRGKCLQMMRALQLERHYSKKALLEAYLNLAPYGGNIEGAEAASLIYYGKPAKALTAAEALTLAVIPQNPLKRPKDPKMLAHLREGLYARLNLHLEDAGSALSRIRLPIVLSHHVPFRAPHALNEVLNRPRTPSHALSLTLDARLQTLLERVVKRHVEKCLGAGVSNAALLLVDRRDMGIRAMVGSADFFNNRLQGQINGTEIRRSPGSTLKPFIYALAFDEGLIHPETLLKDVPRRFGAWNPENFDRDFSGPVKAREALVSSRNIPAIALANRLKSPGLYGFLEQAGVHFERSASWYGLALSLGGAEMSMQELVGLYAMLANGGVWRPLRLETSDPLVSGKRLLSAEASFLVEDILRDTPPPEGFTLLSKRLPLSWKTGTSSGYRDAWAVGVYGPWVLGVWVGNFDNRANAAFVGKRVAAPLLFAASEAIAEAFPSQFIDNGREPPPWLNLRRVNVCAVSGMMPSRWCPETVSTWFIPGKSPIVKDTLHREVVIDKKTGLRACRGEKDVRFEVFEFWPTDLLQVLRRAGIQRKTPPPYAKGCKDTASTGRAPRISSLTQGLHYVINAASPKPIPLTAVADADVTRLYWFVNEAWTGESAPDSLLFWHAKPGRYVVRVVDNKGLSDALEVTVEAG
ncbi:penicillin-binding protein 1C [Legionella geestiana]|nr:penicillin-binding protein 1C [Legionella geestiana]